MKSYKKNFKKNILVLQKLFYTIQEKVLNKMLFCFFIYKNIIFTCLVKVLKQYFHCKLELKDQRRRLSSQLMVFEPQVEIKRVM
jgi:hypothetical protein